MLMAQKNRLFLLTYFVKSMLKTKLPEMASGALAVASED